MPTTTTTYSFNKPVVGADEDDWGGYLNGNWDSVDNLLDGTTPVTGIDINSGTLDGVTIGGTTAGAGTFTTLTATTSITGTLATAAQPNVTSLGTLTSLTVSGDVSFGDNDKAIFGAGSDLQIYHDGSHSYISDQGTGNLRVLADNLYINNAANTQNYISGVSGGALNLFHNGSPKLATTSTGIDVTGTVTADGLTVDGGTGNYGIEIEARTDFTGISGQLAVTDSTGSAIFNTVSGSLNISTGATFGTNTGTQRLQIGSGGDISFYEDTGTTAKFFWDASAERLGIGDGTNTPPRTLHLKNDTPSIRLTDSTANDYAEIVSTDGDLFLRADHGNTHAGSRLSLQVDGTDALYIDDSLNVGIGTTAPTVNLEVANNDQENGATLALTNTYDGYGWNNNDTIGSLQFKVTEGSTTEKVRGSIDVIGTANAANYPAYNDMIFSLATTNAITERMRLTDGGNLGLNSLPPNWDTSNTVLTLGSAAFVYGSTNTSLASMGANAYYDSADGRWEYVNSDYASRYQQIDGQHIWSTAPSGTANAALTLSESARIDASGNLLVGKTSATGFGSTAGFEVLSDGRILSTVSGDQALALSRTSSDGNIAEFYKDSTTVGSIGVSSTTGLEYMYIGSGAVGLLFDEYGTDGIRPFNTNGTLRDNAIDLGSSTARFDDIYATNGTIQTSDANEKQDIAELSEAEQRVAVAAKGLLRKFRWKDAVAEKGDEARTHFGIIAQDLQAAFAAEGLDAGDYAMFIHSTWTDEETGEERSRMGVRYSELLAFIIAAI